MAGTKMVLLAENQVSSPALDSALVDSKGVDVSNCDIIKKQISALFAEQLNIEVPSLQTDLIDAGILDSLKFVDLLLSIEQKFGTRVNMSDLDLDSFRSIERIAEFVVRRQG